MSSIFFHTSCLRKTCLPQKYIRNINDLDTSFELHDLPSMDKKGRICCTDEFNNLEGFESRNQTPFLVCNKIMCVCVWGVGIKISFSCDAIYDFNGI